MLRYGGNTATLLHPLVLLAALVAAGLVWGLPKKYVLIPVIAVMVLTPTGQRLVVPGADFTIHRIMLACVWARLLITGEHRSLKPTPIDKAVMWWVAATVVSYTILWSSLGAFINRLGFAYDLLGTYFLTRTTVAQASDLKRVLKALVWIGVIVAILMVVETGAGRNPFASLGGLPETSELREGRFRAQGPFSHSIMAGTFGATLLPLSIGLWWMGGRWLPVAGIVAACTITLASASSGPALTLIAGIVALCLWPLREHMTWVRRATLAGLIALQIVMKAPVWYLLNRVDVVQGSTGWHRSFLIDNFVWRFEEWVLVGTRYTSTWGQGLVDQTNQYVTIGASGGLLTLVLFVVVLRRCFAGLRGFDRSRRAARWQHTHWALGSALFAHLIAFVGATYFGQMADVWYLFLGTVSAASGIAVEAVETRERYVRNERPLARVWPPQFGSDNA